MQNSGTLTKKQVVAYYDRFGAKQDQQGFYEDQALAEAITYGQFDQARAVVEFGCGTGRYAETLLAGHLPASATYWGCDISTTMLALTRERLSSYGDRVTVVQSDGEIKLPLPDGSADRFVSNYVLDLLPPAEMSQVLAEAHRILAPDGRIDLVSITNGEEFFTKLVMKLWKFTFNLRPSLVGGCRPIELQPLVEAAQFEIQRHLVVVASGVSSEVVVARKRAA